MQKIDVLINPIGELATPLVDGGPAYGEMMSAVRRVAGGAVAVKGDRIVAAGPADEVLAQVEVTPDTLTIDASRSLVTPGLVDAHTHLVFAGNRAAEFIMRCQGKTYAEIARAGGGIVASMKATRQAPVEELVASGLRRLARMLSAGTTTAEVKTGYGLDTDSELRMLSAIRMLTERQPVELIPTFMPAHAVPPGEDRQEYVDRIVRDMLPRAAEYARAEKGFPVPFVDVFCDEGYFNLADTRLILEAAQTLGMKAKVHADEFANLGATTLAVEIGAASADHLLGVSNAEIDLLARSATVAVLLPGTSFYLNLPEHAPARKMIERGVAVALGSDFNPGSCHIFSLPLIFGLACLHLKMTPEEALSALTINSAFAVDCGDRLGQVREGYQADLVVYQVGTLEELPYNLGWNAVSMVLKRGRVVVDHRERSL